MPAALVALLGGAGIGDLGQAQVTIGHGVARAARAAAARSLRRAVCMSPRAGPRSPSVRVMSSTEAFST
jgi:hypothetical protein